MKTNLIGKPVVIIRNEFISHDLKANIEQIDKHDEKMLMKLEQPLNVGEMQYVYVVGSTRLVGQYISDLCVRRMMGLNLIWIPAETFDEARPFDTSWWRAGAADISSVKLV